MLENLPKQFDGLSDIDKEMLEELVKLEAKKLYLADQEREKGNYLETTNYLANVINRPGLYVEYDAGLWDKTVKMPDPRSFFKLFGKYGFGGYVAGQSKNESVTDFFGRITKGGWIALFVDELAQVYLIHAGIAAVYSPPSRTLTSADVYKMNAFCNENFANPNFAVSAQCVNLTYYRMLNQSKSLPAFVSDIGASYWFADIPNGSEMNYYETTNIGLDPSEIDTSAIPDKYHYYDGKTEKAKVIPTELNANGKIVDVYGIRPIVKLRSDLIVTSGNGSRENPFKIARKV